MRTTKILFALLAGLSVVSVASVGHAQLRRSDYSNGIRDAAAKADNDAYYFYTREAYREEGSAQPALAPAPVTGQRSFSRSPAAPANATVRNPAIMYAPMLPVGVIEARAGELRTDLQNSNQTYDRLSQQFKNNSQAEMHLQREHQHRLSALKALDRLQADRRGSKAANTDARAVQSELAAASAEHSWFVQSTQTASQSTTR